MSKNSPADYHKKRKSPFFYHVPQAVLNPRERWERSDRGTTVGSVVTVRQAVATGGQLC